MPQKTPLLEILRKNNHFKEKFYFIYFFFSKKNKKKKVNQFTPSDLSSFLYNIDKIIFSEIHTGMEEDEKEEEFYFRFISF